MSPELDQLFAGIEWHQRWEVEPGVFTPGQNDVARLLKAVNLPERLDGMRVLDVGAWNGCFSFECERRGAAEVLALGPEPAETSGFAHLKSYLHSHADYRLGSVYDLDPETIGRFDFVLCFGVLYHLRYPLLGIDNLRRVCRRDLFLETSCMDNDLILNGRARSVASFSPELDEVPLLQFLRLDELSGDPSNWFNPNRAGVREMLLSAGFEPRHMTVGDRRLYVHAMAVSGEPEFLTIRSGENVYYDVIARPLLGDRGQWKSQVGSE
jgi:tRNA (mo5U34)-methyltransferase